MMKLFHGLPLIQRSLITNKKKKRKGKKKKRTKKKNKNNQNKNKKKKQIYSRNNNLIGIKASKFVQRASILKNNLLRLLEKNFSEFQQIDR